MKWSLMLVFFCCTLKSTANVDLFWYYNKGNIHSWSCLRSPAAGDKLDMFLDLATQLMEAEGYEGHLYLYFDQVYLNVEDPHYALGYGTFTYLSDTRPFRRTPLTGIMLFVREGEVMIGPLLRLVHAAIRNVGLLKYTAASTIGYEYIGRDSVRSIPMDSIAQYRNRSNALTNRLLEQKTFPGKGYRRWRSDHDDDTCGTIRYYMQQEQFHFYKVACPEASKRGPQEAVKEMLVTDDIYELMGKPGKDYLVFTSKDSFYCIRSSHNSIVGPFEIDSMDIRERIRKIDYESDPDRIVFWVQDYDHKDIRKMLLLPDSGVFVTNYGEPEMVFIQSLIQSTRTKHQPGKPIRPARSPVIVALLCIGVGLHLFLLWKGRRRITGLDKQR